MNTLIDHFNNIFASRGITSRDQLLNEMLRIKLTQKEMDAQEFSYEKAVQLFEFMKTTTEGTLLGYFPGDSELFSLAYSVATEISLVDYTLALYKNNRLGNIFSPAYLTEYINGLIEKSHPKTILITEAEKSLAGLLELVQRHYQASITLTSSHVLMLMLLQLSFYKYENVTVIHQSIYQELLLEQHFDVIYSLPNFTGKPESCNRKFISSSLEGVALQNLLDHVSENGMIHIVLPAKIAFSSGSESRLREYVMAKYHLEYIYSLPDGTFRPYSSIKTYLLGITHGRRDTVKVGRLGYEDGLFVEEEQVFPWKEFISHEDWRIELFLSQKDEALDKFNKSKMPKVKLHEVAEVFRGKSILKKDIQPGNINVLNISNITDFAIDYSGLDSIAEEERKVKRYELLEGDVVLSCRGTAIKSAVFHRQRSTVIASANIIVIRPRGRVISEYLKIFLESPVGTALIKSFQRGTTIVNLNPSDIMEMEIPLPSMERQNELVANYESETTLYTETVNKAEERYLREKRKIYEQLI